MSKKILAVVGIIVFGGVGFFIIQGKNTISYELATVELGDMIQEASVSGKIESPTKVKLQFKNSGEIIFLKAEVGQKVKAGEVLAKQDTSLLYAQLNQSQAALKNQEYKLRSREENNIKNYDDKYDIKAQEALVKQAQSDIELQRAKINETVLVAPIDGFIVAADSEIGEIAKPETIIASIISDDKLQIDVDIPEVAIANVKIGQMARITLDAFADGSEWTGRVVDIDSAETIKGGATYYKATIFFDKEDTRFKSGMTANLWIRTDFSENTLFMPISALQKKDNKDIARVLEAKQVKEKEVVTGIKNNSGMIEIISGLSEGEQIVLGDKKIKK
jgi:RND family efflux transporter MFP subunit